MAAMNRRLLIALGLGGAALLLATGHTPYRQWVVYRKRRLLIGTSRADAPTYPLGQKVAETLASNLPESKARPSRAPDPWRLASLLGSAQLDVAILAAADAEAMREGRPPFAEFGGLPLVSLFAMGSYLLVSRDDFPARHAYLVARTLSEHGAYLSKAAPALAARIPLHPAAAAFARGEPVPEAGPVAEPFTLYSGETP